MTKKIRLVLNLDEAKKRNITYSDKNFKKDHFIKDKLSKIE